jgi:hypothetical protein
MGDRERYRAAFQRSRHVVKEWEAAFLAAHQRKPNREGGVAKAGGFAAEPFS